MRQKRRNRNNSGNALPGFPNADVKRFIVPKCPSERRALLKSVTKLWLAVSVIDRTQYRGIPCAAADWATPPASISTAEAPPARKSSFSAAVCATWSMEASTPVACEVSHCGRRTSNRRPAASTAVATKTSPIPSAASSAPQNPILTIAPGRHAGHAISTALPACAAPAPFATIQSCRPAHSPRRAQ